MVAALVVAFVCYAPAHIARGICSGTGRFKPYAIVMGTDGVVRLVVCLILALVGVQAVGAYAFVVALSPMVGITYVYSRGSLKTEPGPEASWGEVTPNLGWLLLGSIFAAGLLNAGPVLTTHPRRGAPEVRGHRVRLRRAARAGPPVHVPGGAGGAAPTTQPARRRWATSPSSAPGSSGS